MGVSSEIMHKNKVVHKQIMIITVKTNLEVSSTALFACLFVCFGFDFHVIQKKVIILSCLL